MTTKPVLDLIEQARSQSVDSEAEERWSSTASGVDALGWLVEAGRELPGWWSQARDRSLTSFWKRNTHLSIAVYSAQSKLIGIPFTIIPRNPDIAAHAEQAEALNWMLHIASDFGSTWHSASAKFYEDLLTQDNGAFLEIIGDGDPSGAIVGAPYAVRHLDSGYCTRTGDPKYPVVYHGRDGKRYKLHFTRVISLVQMPSSRRALNGVGYCAVSRSADIATTMQDVIRFKQERLGSRPPNAILLGKGIRARQIAEAFRMAEQNMDSRGLSRYARTVAIGSENPSIDMKRIDLNHMEPFDEGTSIRLGIYAISAAFGLSVNELWPSNAATSSAEAKIQHMRTRGKLPAQVTAELATQFNLKVVPPHLKLVFDFQDDEEDQMRAVITDIRARSRMRDLKSGAITTRAARHRMLRDGDMPREVFSWAELEAGRLENGLPVESLFFNPHKDYKMLLGGLPSSNPLGVDEAIVDEMLEAIQEKRANAFEMWHRTTAQNLKTRIQQALFALDWLEARYLAAIPNPMMVGDESGDDDTDSDTILPLRGGKPEQTEPGNTKDAGLLRRLFGILDTDGDEYG